MPRPFVYIELMKRIFLDYAAGKDNPNAIYKEGRDAAARLAKVRKTIASVISSAEDEVALTSWGTEANMYLASLLEPGDHVVTTSIEHESLLSLFADLEKSGVKVTYVAPNRDGIVSAGDVEKALRQNTKLVSVMYANNEIGTIQPIKEISRMLRLREKLASGTLAYVRPGANPLSRTAVLRKGIHKPTSPSGYPRVAFHSDCVQAPGLLSVNMQSLGVDLASFSAPKFGGPDGAGLLYRRRWVKSLGDRDLRENVAADLADNMCAALLKAETRREKEVTRLTKLRDYFIDRVLKGVPGSELNGSASLRLANNANFVFPIESELTVIELDNAGVAASGGAACNAQGCKDGSHVIIALGKSKQDAKSSVRFSLGVDTKKSDLDYVVKILPGIINRHTNIWPSRKRQ